MMTDAERYHSFNSVKQSTNTLVSQWHKRWLTGFKYDASTIEFFPPKPFINLSSMQKAALLKNIRYVHHAVLASVFQMTPETKKAPFDVVDNLILEQLNHYNRKLGLCIYASALLYCLLREEFALDNKHLKYVQGFARTKPSKNYKLPSTGEGSDLMHTLHAFVLYQNSVIDTSTIQLEKYLDFSLKPPFVLGEQGYKEETFTYHGFKEYPQTPLKYAKNFAKEVGMTYKEWITHHQTQAKIFSQVKIH